MKIKNFFKHILAVVIVGFLMSVCISFIPIKSSAEETSEITTESSINESEEGTKDIDINKFLEALKPVADEAGVGDEYDKAVEAIKTAATTKQVSINTILSVGSIVLIIGYLIYTKAKNKQLSSLLKTVSEQMNAQVKGTNDLIDGTNDNATTTTETAQNTEKTNEAVGCMAKALISLTDRFNIGSASKETIKADLNKAVALTSEVKNGNGNETNGNQA